MSFINRPFFRSQIGKCRAEASSENILLQWGHCLRPSGANCCGLCWIELNKRYEICLGPERPTICFTTWDCCIDLWSRSLDSWDILLSYGLAETTLGFLGLILVSSLAYPNKTDFLGPSCEMFGVSGSICLSRRWVIELTMVRLTF